MLKSNSQKTGKELDYESTIYKYLYKLPPKGGRYIVLDTETTGLGESAQVVELGAHEIINGKLTGNQFHIYIKPRTQMDKNVINELKHWGLNEIPIKRYRCSMRIFMDIIGKIDIRYSNSFTSLTNCCEYFKLKSGENNFHNALFDSFMTSKMICKIYETLDKNEALRKKLGYNQQVIDCFFPINKRNKNDIIKKSNIDNKNINKINLIKKDIFKDNMKDIINKEKLNSMNIYSNKKVKDLKFKNKNLDKLRLMISSEIEEKFKKIEPLNKNIIIKSKKESKGKENKKNNNIIKETNGSENEDFPEDEIDDIFIELL